MSTERQIPSVDGEPTWEVAALMPPQGAWDEADFLELHTNRMAELVNGRLEVLPMPTWLHQLIVDPEERLITVLGLAGSTYETLGVYRAGQTAVSRYFEEFTIDVAAVFAIIDRKPSN